MFATTNRPIICGRFTPEPGDGVTKSVKNDNFRARYGSWAVIAGGSEGIGAEFAGQLAALGLNLLLVARRKDLLENFAQDLAKRYLVEVRTAILDLSSRSDVETLTELSSGLDVGLLVCNSALSPIGRYLEVPMDLHLQLLDLNCRMPAMLSRAIGEQMVDRRRGGIIFVSSMGSFQGAELVAHYAASKAYLRVLAEGMWTELRPWGVDVIASCAGPVRTPTYLQDRPRHPRWLAVPEMECEPVVRQTLRALGHRPVVIPGMVNRISTWFVSRFLSKRTAIALTSAGTRAIYPQFASWPRRRR